MRKKIIFMFNLFCFWGLVFSVRAEELNDDLMLLLEESKKQQSTVNIIADINIRDAKIWEEEKNHFKLSFNIENYMATRSDLVYGIELIKENPDKSAVLMDEKIFSDDLLLAERDKKVYREIDYFVPEYLSGKFVLWLKIKDEGGLVLAQQSFPVDFFGTRKMLEQSNPCYLTIGEEERKYNLTEGVSLKKDEQLFLNCYAKNNLGEKVSLKPYFEFYRRTFYGLKLEEREGENEIYFEKDEGKINKIVIPLPKNPQAYDVKVNFKLKKQIVSNPVIAHFVLSGKSASINSLVLDKSQYVKGEIAHLDMLWSGSADTFNGSRTGSTGLVDPVFEIEIKDQSDLELCAPKQIKKAQDVDKIVDILLDKDCFKPIALVKIFDEGQLLYEKTIATQQMTAKEKLAWEKGLIQEKFLEEGNFFQKNKKMLWLVSGLILVFILILLWFFRKKKSVLMLFFLLILPILITEKTQAVTAILYGDPWYQRVAGSVVTGTNFVPLSDCGDTYSCYPYCDPLGVNRIIDNCLVNSKVVRHEGNYYGCYRDIVSFNYSLDTSLVNQGQSIQASGSANGDNICNNGITVGMAVSPKNDGVNLYWVLNNNYISPESGISASGSYSFSTAGYACGNYNAAFYYAYKHGRTDDVLESYDKIGSGLIGYTVQNCYSCTGTIPSNATMFPGDDIGLVANTPYTYSPTDTDTKCQYSCNAGYAFDDSNNTCKRIPSPPASISTVCGSGYSISSSWTPSDNTDYYAFRLDDTRNGWPICPPDVMADVVATQNNTTGSESGGYNSWVHSCIRKSNGQPLACSAPISTSTSCPAAPVLDFKPDSQSVKINENASFFWNANTANCTATSDPIDLSWNGVKGSNGNYSRSFSSHGYYTYTLNCSNSVGDSTTKSIEITVRPPIDGKCSDSYNERAICSLPEEKKDLCELGVNPTNIVFSSNKWTWSCPGIDGGVDAHCSARKECPWIEVGN